MSAAANDLDRVCAWCKKDMGKTPSPASGVTHGICQECLDKMTREEALPNEMTMTRNERAEAARADYGSNGFVTDRNMVMRENVTCPGCGDKGRLFVDSQTHLCDQCMREGKSPKDFPKISNESDPICGRCDHPKSDHNADGQCDRCLGKGDNHRFVKGDSAKNMEGGRKGTEYKGYVIEQVRDRFIVYEKDSGDEIGDCISMGQAKDLIEHQLASPYGIKNIGERDVEGGRAMFGSAKNAAGPKVGDLVKFAEYGEFRKIHTVSGTYVEAGDVGMSKGDLKEDGAGHWVYHGKVSGGIGREDD